jgi:hypothetical protein
LGCSASIARNFGCCDGSGCKVITTCTREHIFHNINILVKNMFPSKSRGNFSNIGSRAPKIARNRRGTPQSITSLRRKFKIRSKTTRDHVIFCQMTVFFLVEENKRPNTSRRNFSTTAPNAPKLVRIRLVIPPDISPATRGSEFRAKPTFLQ